MFNRLVVVRIFSYENRNRPYSSIIRFAHQSGSTWHFELQDIDFARGIYGFCVVFKREDAARRYFTEFRDRDVRAQQST